MRPIAGVPHDQVRFLKPCYVVHATTWKNYALPVCYPALPVGDPVLAHGKLWQRFEYAYGSDSVDDVVVWELGSGDSERLVRI